MKTYKTLEKALQASKLETMAFNEVQRINDCVAKYNGGKKYLYLYKDKSRFYLGTADEEEEHGYFYTTTNVTDLYNKIYSFWDFAWLFRNKETEK